MRRLRRAGLRSGLVVDLGCGTGIAAQALLRAGYDVLGADPSADALAIARRRAPGATFVRAGLADLPLPSGCVAIAAIGEVLCYAAHAGGPEVVDDLARRGRAALAPGGLLIADVAEPGREPVPRRAWREGEGWVVCVEASEDRAAGTLRRGVTVFRRADGAWRRADEEHLLRTIGRRRLLSALRAAGLEARTLASYGPGWTAAPGHAAVLARRPPVS